MGPREQFLYEYQTQVLDSLVLPPGLSAQYRALSCLKDGKQQVYLIQDQAGWLAVLKIQPTGREDSLKQEYDLLQRLHHRQIPKSLSYLEWEEKEYLVRQYVEGISLSEQVTDQGTLSADKVREAALSLCQVLAYLHNQNPPVICRDVKPQNVVLDSSGVYHLIDLGAARRYRPEHQKDTVFIGTEATSPPEQFGYRQTDQRSDIYSLGILLRFLYTGDFDPQPPVVIPGVLGCVIRRCTAFDPQNRFSSVQSVSRILKYCRKRFFAAAAAGITCIVIMLGLFLTDASAVQTQSSLLEDALRCELDLDEREPIPKERLKEVKQLLVCGQTVVDTPRNHEKMMLSSHDCYKENTVHGDISDEDLKLLSQCTNLQVLVLDYQRITDLSPLSNLPLSHLSLAGNKISDLNPLKSCPNLSRLTIGELSGEAVQTLKGLTDLTPLLDCPKLTVLRLSKRHQPLVQKQLSHALLKVQFE